MPGGNAKKVYLSKKKWGYGITSDSRHQESQYIEVTENMLRLQKVLERRRQAAAAATSTPTSSVVTETTTHATPEAVPDTKEPKKKKKSRKPKDTNAANKN